MRLKREVPRVDELDDGVLRVPHEALRASGDKHDVVESPHREHGHRARAQVRLPGGVRAGVRLVVEQERDLDVALRRLREQRGVGRVRRGVDVDEEVVGHADGVLCLGGVEGEEGNVRVGLGRGVVERRGGVPEGEDGRPVFLAEALDVGVAVLRDDPGDARRILQCEAEARGSLPMRPVRVHAMSKRRITYTVVKDIHGKRGHVDCLRKSVDCVCNVIKGCHGGLGTNNEWMIMVLLTIVVSLRRLGPSKPRQIGRDGVVLGREKVHEVTELEGRGRVAMQQENGRVGGVTRRTVKDVDPVDVYRVEGGVCSAERRGLAQHAVARQGGKGERRGEKRREAHVEGAWLCWCATREVART